MKRLTQVAFLTGLLLLEGGCGGVLGRVSTFTIPSKISNKAAPMAGLVFYGKNLRSTSPYNDTVSLEFGRFYYKDVIVPVEGAKFASGYQYDWSPVSRFLENAAKRGHHGIIRFRDLEYDTPMEDGVPSDLNLLRNWTASYMGKPMKFTDWQNPDVTAFIVDFYSKFAAAFDGNKNLAYIQVGFGLWGEYHLNLSPKNMNDFKLNGTTDLSIDSRRPQTALGKIFPDYAAQHAILGTVNRVFKQTPWNLGIASGEPGLTDFEANPNAWNYSNGYFDDTTLNDGGNFEFWQRFPKRVEHMNGGEISFELGDPQGALEPRGPHGVSLTEAVKDHALTFLLGDSQISDDPEYAGPHMPRTTNEILAASRALGYRFKVVSASTDGATTTVTLKNTGVAGVFFDVYPALGKSSSLTNLRGLLPGQQRACVIYGQGTGQEFWLYSPKLLPGQVIPFEGN